MTLSPLTAIAPIDGRYHQATQELAAYFSEYALIRYRVFVEVVYFISLAGCGIPQLRHFDGSVNDKLREIYINFEVADASSSEERRVRKECVRPCSYGLST